MLKMPPPLKLSKNLFFKQRTPQYFLEKQGFISGFNAYFYHLKILSSRVRPVQNALNRHNIAYQNNN